MNKPKKLALITTNQLNVFSGSEMVFLEVANELKKLNFDVFIYANFINRNFRRYIKEYKIIKLPFLHNLDNFDFVWSQHNLLPFFIKKKIIRNDKERSVFLVNLSSFVDYEFSSVQLGKELGLKFVTISEEAKLALSNFNVDIHKVFNFKNSAPIDFYNPNNRSKLKKVLFISNYLTEELIKVKELLRKKNYIVDHFGEEVTEIGGGYLKITPEILSSYDLCITMAKSVYYCLLNSLPVYVYGPFGGPGYINLNNIDLSEKYNFSGRCTNRKLNYISIVDEIENYYDLNIKETKKLNDLALKRYNLNEKINFLITQKYLIDFKNYSRKYLFYAIKDKIKIIYKYKLQMKISKLKNYVNYHSKKVLSFFRI